MTQRYAIVENGKVVNVVVADAPLESNWVPGENAAPGDLYQNGQFVTAPPDTEAAAERVRAIRNGLLTQTDWTQLADAPVDDLAWATYRQALRDIPTQSGFPLDVVWPVAPGGA